MKEELIALSKSKGFESLVIGKSVNSKYSNKPFYFLWLCELQKWFREVYGINIQPSTDICLEWVCLVQSLHPEASYTGESKLFGSNGHTYEQVLEEGLLEALKLIEK